MWVMLAILGLHVGIWLTMDILFILSVYELIILAFPWDEWIDKMLERRRRA